MKLRISETFSNFSWFCIKRLFQAVGTDIAVIETTSGKLKSVIVNDSAIVITYIVGYWLMIVSDHKQDQTGKRIASIMYRYISLKCVYLKQ